MTYLPSLLCAVLLAQTGTATAPKPKMAIIPFAAITAEVSTRIGVKAQGMLTTELKSAEAFELVEPPKDKVSPDADTLEPARKSVAEAQALREKRKFRLAADSLQQALRYYQSHASLLDDVAEVVDAYALLSAVQYNTGHDDEAARSLRQALAMAPHRELPLAQTSNLFAKVVFDTRKVVKDAAPGTLLFESTPANAPVMLDGVAVGSTPLLVKEVPPGLHFWKVTLPSQEVLGGAAEVTAQKQAVVKVSSVRKGPETRLLAALAQNRLDSDAVAAAAEYAKALDSAWLLLGGISKHGKGLALDTFLYSKEKGELRRMARTTFDTELLSAGMEFYSLVGELSQKGDSVGDVVKVPAAVSLTLERQGPSALTEVRFSAQLQTESGDASADVNAEDGPKKPVEPKRRAPLKQK